MPAFATACGSARAHAGRAVRRVRRERQWRRDGVRELPRVVADASPYEIIRHATPLFRELAGVDQQLQRNKVVNLRHAIATLDGRELAPGARLSVWRHVGPPTAHRGYLDGLVLRSGELTTGVGGGLCQLTNLLYWLTIHTPLTVLERWRHSYDVFPDVHRTHVSYEVYEAAHQFTCDGPGTYRRTTSCGGRCSTRTAPARMTSSSRRTTHSSCTPRSCPGKPIADGARQLCVTPTRSPP